MNFGTSSTTLRLNTRRCRGQTTTEYLLVLVLVVLAMVPATPLLSRALGEFCIRQILMSSLPIP